MSSCSKFSASGGPSGLFPGRRPYQLLHHLIEEQLHESDRRFGPEDHEPDPAAARSSERGEHAALLAPSMHHGPEAGRTHDPGQLLGRGHDRRPQRGGGHHLERAGESVLGHNLARCGHQQDEPRRRLGEERLQRRFNPGLERTHQARRPTASSISTRASPRFASAPASATSTRSFRPGAASTDPVLPRRCTKVGIRIPAPAVARTSR